MNTDAVNLMLKRHDEIIRRYETADEAFDRVLNTGVASGIWYALMALGCYHEADYCQQALIEARTKRMKKEGIM